MDSTNESAIPNLHEDQRKAVVFVVLTFEDVLSEVKHALLDSVPLLCDLHVFINLMKDKCIRALCTKYIGINNISCNIL